MSQQCINVSITDDAELENDEVFFINISTSDPAVSLSSSSAVVIISDNDGVCWVGVWDAIMTVQKVAT